MNKLKIIALLILTGNILFAQNTKRWNLSDNQSICWGVKKGEAHSDHIEMSGTQMSAIIHYRVGEKSELSVQKKLIFPMLRTIQNKSIQNLLG